MDCCASEDTVVRVFFMPQNSPADGYASAGFLRSNLRNGGGPMIINNYQGSKRKMCREDYIIGVQKWKGLFAR